MKFISHMTMLRLMRFWPPYLGAGVSVKDIEPDLTGFTVVLKLNRFNRNYVGTQFGGSLYAMTDPFYMLMLIHHLGREYIVWDKAATIRFKKPGKGTVFARFELSKERIDEIRRAANAERKVEPEFQVLIKDAAGTVIAEVDKTLYVRRKA